MPIYCYETPKGTVTERTFPIGKAPQHITHADPDEGVVMAKRSFRSEGVKSASPKGWPMTCYASGVNAEQAGALRSHLAEKGVPTEVTKDGDPVYTSSSHRRKALSVRGIHDNNSFY